MPYRFLHLVVILLALSAGAHAGEYVWLEAEDADHQSGGGYESDDALSGGRWKWINNQPTAPERYLEYDTVPIADGGAYQVYVRKFWKHGPLRWRFGDHPWTTLTRAETVLLDSVSVGSNSASWVHLGQVDLGAGDHGFRVEMIEASGASAIDCFCITNQPFFARGKLKPNEKYGTAPDGWFPFEPDLDPFTTCPIDLRRLNEQQAGDHGFIQAEGPTFVHGDNGEPVRFWAVNAGADIAGLDDTSLAYLARQYAKYGVNMVRYHSSIWDGAGDDAGTLDQRKVDNLLRLIAAMKREGIYTTISLYFPLWMQPGADHPILPGYTGDGSDPCKPFALLFFHQDFQDMYRSWWRTLFETVNPATGLTLDAEPAVAAIELVNEDSFLFWTFNPNDDPSNIPAAHHDTLKQRFHDWLVARYGSIDAAYDAWGSNPITGDDPDTGRMAFRHLWAIQEYRTARDQDTTRFLAETQMDFFTETRTFLREDLGYQACVSCSNWKTANDEILGPADKYSNTIGDHMDRHGYFGPSVTGDGTQSYSVRVGHEYYDRAAVRFDAPVPGDDPVFTLPIMDHAYNDKPSITSEIAWSRPNRFRADGPLLMAAYGALQGTDGIYHFATTGPTWQQMLSKWALQAPITLGQFPAAALLYRQGLVRTAPVVTDISLSTETIYGLEGTPAPEPGNFDIMRLGDIPGTIEPGEIIDPFTYLVGRVAVTLGEDAGTSTIDDLSAYIDRAAGSIASVTGELDWNYTDGLVRVDSPFAQGATGFLADAGPIACSEVQFDLDIAYGTVIAVPLDARPLRHARCILLQVISEETNNGFTTGSGTDGRKLITDLGSPPLVIRDLAGTVSFTRPDAAQLAVTALDLNGYPVTTVGSADQLDLAADVLYYLIEAPVTDTRTIRMRTVPGHLWDINPAHGGVYPLEATTIFDGLQGAIDYVLDLRSSGAGTG